MGLPFPQMQIGNMKKHCPIRALNPLVEPLLVAMNGEKDGHAGIAERPF
jgi:hypothetical protein